MLHRAIGPQPHPVLLIFSVRLPAVTATGKMEGAGEDAAWARTRLTPARAGGGSNHPAITGLSPTISVRDRRPGSSLAPAATNRSTAAPQFY
jgi:hypothetical protein